MASLGDLDQASRAHANYLELWERFGALPEAMIGLDPIGARIGVRSKAYLLRPGKISGALLFVKFVLAYTHLETPTIIHQPIEIKC